MTTTSEKILQTIKEKHLKPDPRWKFLAKNSMFWLAFIIALIIGALSFAVMLEVLVNHDWDIYLYLHKSFLQYLIISLPYIWILSLGLFSWVAYYNFVHIKGWYRHHVYVVIFASVASSMCLGAFAYEAGLGNKVDEVFSSNVPYYQNLKLNKKDIWNHPSEGLVAGDIVEVVNPEEFIIKDLSGNTWDIDSQNALKQDPVVIVGERVKIIGKEETENHKFDAKEVRDWDSRTKNKSKIKTVTKQDNKNNAVCNAESKCNESEEGE